MGLPAALILFACKQDIHTEAPVFPDSTSSTMEQSIQEMESHDSICGIPVMDYLTGKFDPSTNADFVAIPASYTDKNQIFLRKETLEAFEKMAEAARSEGLVLRIVSATRNFDYQKGIWENKWSGKTLLEGKINATSIINPVERARQIMKYSSMPGASRHHWGTDLDINQLSNTWFERGEGKKLYDWMQTEGKKFGFYQVYTARSTGRSKGYEEEKWHYTYKPVSKLLTKLADQMMTNDVFSGFSGSTAAPGLGVKENYVMGINPECYE